MIGNIGVPFLGLTSRKRRLLAMIPRLAISVFFGALAAGPLTLSILQPEITRRGARLGQEENVMRTRGTHVRRGASPHRGRSTRTRGRAMVRRQPARRRDRYGRRARTSQPSYRKSLMAAVVAAILVLALAIYLMAHHGIATNAADREADPVAAQFIYAAPTANDATITLPHTVQNELLQIGLAHQTIALTRVGITGDVTTAYIDMTPRTGNSSSDPVLKVNGRAVPVIDAKISAIEKAINSPAATTGGGQALYAGLTKTDFTGAPVIIISTGIDLANPDDFRSLKWSVSPKALVAVVKRAGALPTLHSSVTFVIVPTAGPQPQLGRAQKNYRNAVWTALLTAAGATSVTFIDANGTTASPGAASAPTVAVPALPVTPIPSVPVGKNSVRCTLPASYFIFDTAKLIDAAETKQALTPCIHAAVATHATFALDGWTSYEGPVNASGKPATDYAYNRKLSIARVQTIANLLVNDLGVPRSAITRLTGHGNVNQPDPADPRSPANRVVVITYTVK